MNEMIPWAAVMAKRKPNMARFGNETHTENHEYSSAEILDWLKRIESSVAAGKPLSEGVGEIGISEETYRRWRAEYGEPNTKTRLERESARLKRVTGFLAETEKKLDERLSENSEQ